MVGWSKAIMLAAIGAPLAAAQPAPSSPPGVQLVFFDWGKPEINGDAAAILDGVAEGYRREPGARLELAGHSDRSGPAGANRVAGLRRAGAVRAYLAAHGVPTSAMHVASFGEERPLIPTEDGVREPQNRRVEIRVEPEAVALPVSGNGL
ncbi:MAG: OmpA family protein [Sphingomonas sp.]|uniref:OmpA family protein n=1 Tax=Sphingomonas sp. TaxID=28214 RepID=UPI00180A219B|nr:OmpA family protein [Sphingomonas sp.]MBA3668355.1 OmpA family protein [Sphingomonas sp.]